MWIRIKIIPVSAPVVIMLIVLCVVLYDTQISQSDEKIHSDYTLKKTYPIQHK